MRKGLLNYLSQGIYVGGVRGRDSTGIMLVGRENYGVEVIKQAVDGGVFLDQYNVDKALFDVEDYACAVVHHRKATSGAVISKNAHPFTVGDITLVHNGTILNHRTLNGCSNINVDSEAIAHAINDGNTLDVLENLDGAFTLIWFDKSTNTFSLAKNKERPISIAYTKDDNLLFASEMGMMNWLASRNDISVTSTFSPAANTLYQWKIDDKDKFSVRNFNTKPFEEYDDPYKYAYGNYGGRRSDWSGTDADNRVPFKPASGGSSKVFKGTGQPKIEREKALEKFSLKVGDTVEWVGYEFKPYSVQSAQGIVKGVDTAMQFEIVSYSVNTNQGEKGWANALCTGTVLTVADNKAYPYWITVVVTNPTIVSEDYYEKKSFEAVVQTVVSGINEPAEEVREEDTETVVEMVKGQGGKFITRKKWDQLTSGGCSNCSCNLYHPDDVLWTHEGNPMCQWCVGDEDFAELVFDFKGI